MISRYLLRKAETNGKIPIPKQVPKQLISESEQEEFHCLMADDDADVFDFYNVEFTHITIGLVKVAENRLVDCISEDIYQQTSLLYRESFLPTYIETVQEMFVFGTVRVTLAINRFGNSKFNATSFAINRYDDVSYSRNIRYHGVTIRFSYNGHITDMMTSATVEEQI
ncbi:TTF-type zinc finger protein with HAT dimerization domain [Dorcoceras hygrometricum]|uniref:TTF-type zinc finger protein with HAT dimerization domain n=1 Tax=Dorcoceras hygrometricum TaxID=472368 RepID=A0A2Z7DEM8_9LAMI|nr:TTF-type zinc finger protein with HAT dimerization domain [Dorcoceras hygrometricum]